MRSAVAGVATPRVEDGELNAVAARSTTEAWAVGSLGPADDPADDFRLATRLLTMQWDGSRWKAVPTPKINGSLYGVAITRTGEAWAVGASEPAGKQPDSALVIRWSGRAWTAHVR